MTNNENPFLALFEAPHNGPAFEEVSMPSRSEPEPVDPDTMRQKINDTIEDCFGITLDKDSILGNPGLHLTFVKDMLQDDSIAPNNRTWMDVEFLEKVLLDRLLMTRTQLKDSLVSVKAMADIPGHSVCLEFRCVFYLVKAYRRLNIYSRKPDELHIDTMDCRNKLKSIIATNLMTSLIEPEIFPGQNLDQQLFEILKDEFDKSETFFARELFQKLTEDLPEDSRFKLVASLIQFSSNFPDSYVNLHEWAKLVNFVSFVFTASHEVATTFLQQNFPKYNSCFSHTFLGEFFTASILPRSKSGPYEHFDKDPRKFSMEHHEKQEKIAQNLLMVYQDALYGLTYGLIRKGEHSKHLTLKWIGDCLHVNEGRGKLWRQEFAEVRNQVSDGFMMNLLGVMLKMCNPFIEGVRNPKLLRIDTRYGVVKCPNEDARRARSVHLVNFSGQDFILGNEALQSSDDQDVTFNFITDIFYITHKIVDLGQRVLHEGFLRLNQEVKNMQQLIEEATGPGGLPMSHELQDKLTEKLRQFFCVKATLLQNDTLDGLLHFGSTTAALLVHEAFKRGDPQSQVPETPKFPIDFDDEYPIQGLSRIPELFFSNICEITLFLRRFHPMKMECFSDNLYPLMDWILTFMGSPQWVSNPHMRAKLAEVMYSISPLESKNHTGPSLNKSTYNRETLLDSHSNWKEMVPTLLSVFSDIETTGHAVEFELKFSYRKPMYDVMNYLWTVEKHRKRFIDLAETAEAHIEDESAPLFLRFVNLLVNDAIFLLDEGLSFMKQIQEKENEQQQLADGNSEQGRRPEQITREIVSLGRMARYHNIMGKETIGLLDLLTGTTNKVFTHNTMVDRIASMLNYFLKCLVGPERKSFKVKNASEFEFAPADTVATICKIYVNLESSQTFVLAISEDGRSYNEDLFDQTIEVLHKINGFDIIEGIKKLGKKVKEAAENQREDDELFQDAPDHYLDPIMSVLMVDPVKLPSSGQIVDRRVISRHLLSDQSDPFNREPLSLDKLIPQPALKSEIADWMQKKRKEKK